MTPDRRAVLTIALGLGLAGGGAPAGAKEAPMSYGLTGSIIATPGRRDELRAMLADAARRIMPGVAGCRVYAVGVLADQPDAVWVTEIWTSAEQHRASLRVPEIADLIARARPLIAGMGERIELALDEGHIPG